MATTDVTALPKEAPSRRGYERLVAEFPGADATTISVLARYDTGDPLAFPPAEYGLGNYVAIFDEDIRVLWNTLIIAVMATAMAILIGFTLAWILTRTNVPGRAVLERLMELPYYMTPLVGALAFGLTASMTVPVTSALVPAVLLSPRRWQIGRAHG